MKLICARAFSDETVANIEKKMNAKFVMESCLKGKHGWLNGPAAFFYCEEAHPEGSNYFALYYNPLKDGYYITNGICITEGHLSGIKVGDAVVYSRYRHDYFTHGAVMVDGGRDYFRGSKAADVQITVVDGNLIFKEH